MANHSNITSSTISTTTVWPLFLEMALSQGNYSTDDGVGSNGTDVELMDDRSAYYSEALLHFIARYRTVHGELSLAVCVFGIIANVLNIIVLSRKNMISPTNAILTGMAVSDLVVIAIYIPYVIHYFLRPSASDQEKMTHGWALYTLVYAIISVVFHSISIWLTVILAVWRYVTVRSPTGNKSSCSMSRALIAIGCTYVMVPAFCVPIYICFTIQQFSPKHEPNVTLYKVDMVEHHPLLQKINFWAFSVLLKLIPCIALTYLSLALVKILIEARKRKERLLGVGKFHHHHHHTNRNHSAGRIGNAGICSAEESKPLNLPNAATAELITTEQPGSGNGEIYLELADNSPTDRSSKSSRGEESIQESGCFRTAVNGCFSKFCLNFCGNILDRCYFCCGLLFCCFGLTNCNTTTFCCPPRTPTISASAAPTKFKYTPSSIHSNTHHHHHHQSQASGNSERTTRMLIAVLIMFLVCEFPSGILALLSGILGKLFFNNVYNNFGEIMDMLALINSAVNFVLYCLMSQQFRKTFSQLFCIRWTERVSTTGGNSAKRIFCRPEATFATELMGTYHGEDDERKGSGSSVDSSKSAKSRNSRNSRIVDAIEMTTPKRQPAAGNDSKRQENDESKCELKGKCNGINGNENEEEQEQAEVAC